MTTLRIINGFNRLSDAALEAKTNQIVNDLTLHFPSAPTLAALAAARDEFVAALAVAADGSLIQKAIKNQKRLELINQHYVMIPYVQMACAGDRVMALKSGYNIARDPSPSPSLTPAQNLAVVNGISSGELLLTFNKVPGARSYIYQSTPDPLTDASVWSINTGTSRKHLFTGLEAGKRYWIRVIALGVKNQEVYSDPVLSKLVQ